MKSVFRNVWTSVIAGALGGLMTISAAQAVGPTVVDGNFTGVANPGIGGSAITGWSQGTGITNSSSKGNTCVVISGVFCTTTTWGTGHSNDLPTGSVPGGGNYYTDPLSSANSDMLYQTISNLIVGATYAVSFYQASFALSNASTTAIPIQWAVDLQGDPVLYSPAMNVSSAVGTGWQAVTLSFVAQATSEVLSFVTYSTSSAAVSQFAALANVSIAQAPEPASLAVVAMGIGGLALLRRRRRLSLAG